MHVGLSATKTFRLSCKRRRCSISLLLSSALPTSLPQPQNYNRMGATYYLHQPVQDPHPAAAGTFPARESGRWTEMQKFMSLRLSAVKSVCNVRRTPYTPKTQFSI